MTDHEGIFHKMAAALLNEYSSIYYVNAVTGEYQWYSHSPEQHTLQIEPGGKDFFRDLARNAMLVVHEEDRHIFTEEIRKEKLLAQLQHGMMQTIEYRRIIDGNPVWHTLRLIRGFSMEDDYFILGVSNIDREVRQRQASEQMKREREIYNQIAESLAGHYDTLYYVNMDTGEYFEFSSTDVYKSLDIPDRGSDYFSESRRNIRRYIHPEDQNIALQAHDRDAILHNLSQSSTYTVTYRVIVNETVKYVRCSEIWARDHRHVIICIENVSEEVLRQRLFEETQKKSRTYGQIAESLASQYDVIYYVHAESGSFTGYTSNSIYGNLEVRETGTDFFQECRYNIERLIHPHDKPRIQTVLDRDFFLSTLAGHKQYSTDYRMVVNGQPQYTRMTLMWASDKQHFIIGVENVQAEVLREQEQIKALNNANALARRDELTGIKNKTAFHELEEAVQRNMETGLDYLPYAIVVCDINDLKRVNDNFGHNAGDEYIRTACKMICDVFAHSPVFRIGGDEFVAFLGGNDYKRKQELVETLRSQVLHNLETQEGPIIAVGMAEYEQGKDFRICEVFDRADHQMYEDKRSLKARKTHG